MALQLRKNQRLSFNSSRFKEKVVFDTYIDTKEMSHDTLLNTHFPLILVPKFCFFLFFWFEISFLSFFC